MSSTIPLPPREQLCTRYCRDKHTPKSKSEPPPPPPPPRMPISRKRETPDSKVQKSLRSANNLKCASWDLVTRGYRCARLQLGPVRPSPPGNSLLPASGVGTADSVRHVSRPSSMLPLGSLEFGCPRSRHHSAFRCCTRAALVIKLS